jgi:magnesium transporter
MQEAKYYHLTSAGKLARLNTLEETLAAREKSGFVWLNYFRPTREELSILMEPLGLHPLSIEDCTDENQIPKIEDYPHHTFILFNVFTHQDHQLTISEVDMFIGKDFLVTVSGNNGDAHDLINSIEHYVEMDIKTARLGPAFLAHVLLDHIVDEKFVAIEALEEEINHTEDVILSDLANFRPADLLNQRRDLLALRKSLFHEREILVKICRKDCHFIPDKAIFFYRDIYDHLTKFFELTESSRDVVTSLMEMYLSMLNNQMTRVANDTNITVRRLTFITTIFMPLTLLAGIGGMSEWSMMTGPENWRTAYPLFLLGMVVLGLLNYFLLKWLEKRRSKRGE